MSPLLRLPDELRNRIYTYVAGHVMIMLPPSPGRRELEKRNEGTQEQRSNPPASLPADPI